MIGDCFPQNGVDVVKASLDRKNPNTNKGRLGILDECN